MALSLQLPQKAARLWSNPSIRAKIIAMHARNEPLLDMISALGLDDILDSDGLRETIEGLSEDEVAIIREAFISEARAAERSGASFPIDCRVDDPFSGGGVAIVASSAGPGAVGPIVRVNQVASQD